MNQSYLIQARRALAVLSIVFSLSGCGSESSADKSGSQVDSVAPQTPSGVVATAGSCSMVNISWNASAAGSEAFYGYKVYRNGVFFRWVLLTNPTPTSTVDRNIVGGNTYDYTVEAASVTGTLSAVSAPARVNVPLCGGGAVDTTPPSTPTGLSGSASSCSAASLSWSASSDPGGSGLKGYRVYRNNAMVREVLAPTTSTNETGLSASTNYSYAISAFDNSNNESARSAALQISVPACPVQPPANRPPKANAGQNQTLTLPANVPKTATILNGSGTDPDGNHTIASYAWSKIDGPAVSVSGSTTQTLSLSAMGPGVYNFRLTVRDNQGAEDLDDVKVTVNAAPAPTNQPPTAVISGADPRSTEFGNALTFSGSASSDADGTIASYVWNFGDGTTTANGVSASHSFASPGSFTVRLTVTDNQGASSFDEVTVIVSTPTGGDPSTWALRGGGTATDLGQKVVVRNNNIVVAGRIQDSTTRMFLAKYAANGTQAWSRTSSGSGQAEAYSVAVDSANNVVVAGWFNGTVDFGTGPVTAGASTSSFVAKFSANGTPLWTKVFIAASSTIIYDLATDNAGDVIVTGFYQSSMSVDLDNNPSTPATVFAAVFGGVDTFAAKLAGSDGRFSWFKSYGHASDDIGYGVAVDSANNVILTGFMRSRMVFPTDSGTSIMLIGAGANDIFLAKVNGTNGNALWAKSFGGSISERGYDVITDAAGSIFLTGFFQGGGTPVDLGGGALPSFGSTDIFAAKFSNDGVHQWSKSGGGSGEDYGFGIALDASGSVFVTGRFKETSTFSSKSLVAAGNADIFVASYNAGSGALIDAIRFGSTGTDIANGIAVNGTHVVLTGSFENTVDFDGKVLTSAGDSDLVLANVLP